MGEGGSNGVSRHLIEHVDDVKGEEGTEWGWDVDVLLQLGKRGVDDVLHAAFHAHSELACGKEGGGESRAKLGDENGACDTTVGVPYSNGSELGGIGGALMKSKGVLCAEECASGRGQLVVGDDVEELNEGGEVRLIGRRGRLLGGGSSFGSCGGASGLGVECVGFEDVDTVGKGA